MTNYRPLRAPYRVLILDDHRFIGELLAQRLSTDHQIEVVAIAQKASAGLHQTEEHALDIALLDMELGDDDGIEVAREMLVRQPALRIVGLSAHCESHYPIALLEAGGRGFLSKRSSSTEVVDAVRRVARGDLAISADVAYYLATETQDSGKVKRMRGLTAKEVEVLKLLSLGQSVGEISRSLAISIKTVQSHRANVKRKLQLKTDVELCLTALKAGIVRLRDTV